MLARYSATALLARRGATAASPSVPHVPVMLEETVRLLTERRVAGDFVDGTCGCGGHSRRILEQTSGRLLCIDRDPSSFAVSREVLHRFEGRTSFFIGSFVDMPQALRQAGLAPRVSGILLDLGMGTHQKIDTARGFDYRHARGELDLRYDQSRGATAQEYLNSASIASLESLLQSETYFSPETIQSVVASIVEARERHGIDTAEAFVSLVEPILPRDRRKNIFF